MSVLILFFILWPAVAVYALFQILFTLAGSIVLSPALPVLLGSLILHVLAAADAIRLAWKWFYKGERFEIKANIKRPLILLAAGFACFWIGVVLAATIIMDYFNYSTVASAALILF